MGASTVVDTAALAAAGAAATRQSRDVEAAGGSSGRALSRLSSQLSGAQSAVAVGAVRQAGDGVLGDLGRALARLGGLLSVAALQYADAEEASTVTAPASSSGTVRPAPGRVAAQ
jgi:hypothetical protein